MESNQESFLKAKKEEFFITIVQYPIEYFFRFGPKFSIDTKEKDHIRCILYSLIYEKSKTI